MSQERARTPVIVGVGQVANKAASRLAVPLELLVEAVDAALADARAPRRLPIDAVYSTPASVFDARPLAHDLCDHLGLPATAGAGSTFSGAAPLTLLAQACDAIVAGRSRVAVVGGAVAEASVKNARAAGVEPPAPQSAPWSQGSAARGDLPPGDERTRRLRGAESAAGVRGPAEIFALVESALAAVAGRNPADQRAWLGTVMSPFTAVAATRPHLAWQPYERQPLELSTVTETNRLVAEPYPKRMCSYPMVDLAAAVLVTTEAVADELGVPPDVRVYPWATVHASELGPASTRPVLHRSIALEHATRRVLRNAGVGVDDISMFDVYSCFPAAVQLVAGALGMDPLDGRGLTLTGGLPYFGGPAANYSTHAIACAVEACREDPRGTALVVGVGGAPSDFGAAVLSAAPPPTRWTHDECSDIDPELQATRVDVDVDREGVAVVDAMTVLHDREHGPVSVALVASFPDGTRTGARSFEAATAAALSGTTLVGEKVRIFRRDGQTYFDAG